MCAKGCDPSHTWSTFKLLQVICVCYLLVDLLFANLKGFINIRKGFFIDPSPKKKSPSSQLKGSHVQCLTFLHWGLHSIGKVSTGLNKGLHSPSIQQHMNKQVWPFPMIVWASKEDIQGSNVQGAPSIITIKSKSSTIQGTHPILHDLQGHLHTSSSWKHARVSASTPWPSKTSTNQV